MPGPATVSVAEVNAVGEGGSPEMDAPAGTSAPQSSPLGPAARAGEPGRSTKSLRRVVAVIVLVAVFASRASPTTFPFAPFTTPSGEEQTLRERMRSTVPFVGRRFWKLVPV